MPKLYSALILLLALAMASCGSSKKNARVAYTDDIYDDGSTEAAIASEMLQHWQSSSQSCTDVLLAEAYSWRGTPYKSGGHSKKGTDCSGYTMEVYLTALGIELPRNSAKQSEYCEKINYGKAQPGDLLFFHPAKKGKVSHVGIYLGSDKMIHASSRGVMVSDLTIPYWRKCFNHAGRVPRLSQMIADEKKKKGKLISKGGAKSRGARD